jgi:predicted nucleic acid-binding protein
VALDTNVLAYAEGIDGSERRAIAVELLRRLPQDSLVIPAQALGELFNVLTRKAGQTRREARDRLMSWRDAFATADTSTEIMLLAADLATDHQLGIWDSVILATASRAGCRLLLSEDLQDGFTWGGVTIVDPFAAPRHALLDALLERGSS